MRSCTAASVWWWTKRAAPMSGKFQSSGFPCGDAVLQRIAGDLWYRWLPNDEFPPPVELVQTLSFTEKVGI